MIARIIRIAVIISQQVFFTITAVLKVSVFSKRPSQLHSLRPVEATECVILGNGPSLKESLAEHPDFLSGKKSLCTNDFADSEYFGSIKPSYYIFTDPTYWSRLASDRFQKVFAEYGRKLEKVDWPLVIFMPVAAKAWNYFQDLPKRNPQIRLVYFNSAEVNCFKTMRFWLYRHNLAVPPLQNVMAAGIFLSLNMGFEKTYVLGGDHSWHESLSVDEENRLMITNTRFQDKAESSKSPFYEDPGESNPYNMHRLFHAFSRMHLGYMELESYATSIGARIYNASKKSYIDSFERLNLDQPQ